MQRLLSVFTLEDNYIAFIMIVIITDLYYSGRRAAVP